MARGLIAFMMVPLLAGCVKDEAIMDEVDAPFVVMMPLGAPALPVPADNALTVSRVALGKALFFDERLSLGHGLSCASCHHPSRAFSDTVALSSGANGLLGERNAPTLANLAWHPAFFADGGIPTLEQQVLAPLHDEREMDGNINTAAEQLRWVEPYASLSQRAYGRVLDAFTITRAIAAYERTLVSGWSRFDRFYYGNDATALTSAEQNGWAVFQAKGCAQCHSGHDFTDHSYRNVGAETDLEADPGRQRITLHLEDRGKFKVPTLRNVALSAPYMHDGSQATLADVIDHFNNGGDGSAIQDPLMQPLGMSGVEKADLEAFLRALTDDRSLDQVP